MSTTEAPQNESIITDKANETGTAAKADTNEVPAVEEPVGNQIATFSENPNTEAPDITEVSKVTGEEKTQEKVKIIFNFYTENYYFLLLGSSRASCTSIFTNTSIFGPNCCTNSFASIKRSL